MISLVRQQTKCLQVGLQHPKHVTNPYGPLKNFMIIFCWSRSCRVQTVVYYELPEPNRRKYSEIVQASFREMIILFFHFFSFGCSLSESSSGNSFACSFFLNVTNLFRKVRVSIHHVDSMRTVRKDFSVVMHAFAPRVFKLISTANATI